MTACHLHQIYLHLGCSYHLHSSHHFHFTWGVIIGKKMGKAEHYGTKMVPLQLITSKNMMQIVMVKIIAILTSKLPECAHGENNYVN